MTTAQFIIALLIFGITAWFLGCLYIEQIEEIKKLRKIARTQKISLDYYRNRK